MKPSINKKILDNCGQFWYKVTMRSLHKIYYRKLCNPKITPQYTDSIVLLINLTSLPIIPNEIIIIPAF